MVAENKYCDCVFRNKRSSSGLIIHRHDIGDTQARTSVLSIQHRTEGSHLWNSAAEIVTNIDVMVG